MWDTFMITLYNITHFHFDSRIQDFLQLCYQLQICQQ